MIKLGNRNIVMDDGSLYLLSPYLSYSLGDKSIILDGTFDVKELKEVLDYIIRQLDNSKESAI